MKRFGLHHFIGWNWIGVCLLIGWMLIGPSSVSAQSNLIQNPGFESTGNWSLSNWASSTIDCGYDTSQFHTGSRSYRVGVLQLSRPNVNVQFLQKVSVTPGQRLQLRFWLRGASANSPSITVLLRKINSPYTSYFSQTITTSTSWQEYVYELMLPDHTDANDTALFFQVGTETTVWIDDVTLIEPNLIQNPSFESTGNWSLNNWAGSTIDCGYDTNQFHTGSRSYRVGVLQLSSPGVNVQFQQTVSVSAGQQLQLRFWLRGAAANVPSISVLFRKINSPYTSYFSQTISPSTQWQEYVYNLILPSNVDPSDTALFFQVGTETTVWIDDVKLFELVPVDPNPAKTGNLLGNGSFEIGTDRWYGTFRESGSFRNGPLSEERNNNAMLEWVSVSGAPHGTKAMQVVVQPSCSLYLTTAHFAARYGVAHTLGFWMKASRPSLSFEVGIGNGRSPNTVWIKQTMTTANNTNWNFYQLPATMAVSTSGRYFVQLLLWSDATYQIDGVCVNEGTTALATASAFNNTQIGWMPDISSPQGHVYEFQYDVLGNMIPTTFTVLAASATANSNLNLTGRIVNAWDQTLENINLTLAINASGVGQTTFSWTNNNYIYGAFKCELFLPTDTVNPATEMVWHYPAPVTPIAERTDDFYGGHAKFQDYNLDLLARCGMNWLRMHPPLSTKWVMVEANANPPQPQVFSYETAGIIRASQKGFKILGSLAVCPPVYSRNPSVPVDVWASYAPATGYWPQWHNYVVTTMTQLAPYINTWEIWNEPDSTTFLKLLSGEQAYQVYHEIAQQTKMAVQNAGLTNIKLIGPAVCGILGRNFIDNWLNLSGAPETVDGLSFHYYGKTPGQPLLDRINQISGRTGRSGMPHELWMTEGGWWLSENRSWLATSGIYPNTPDTMIQAAGGLAKTLSFFKALGFKHYFHYINHAQLAGSYSWRDECSNMFSVNGIPHPSYSAHAANAMMLENMVPDGIRSRTVGGVAIWIASFHRDYSEYGVRQMVDVVWSASTPVALSQAVDFSLDGAWLYDVMGNWMELTGASATEIPVYIHRYVNIDGGNPLYPN